MTLQLVVFCSIRYDPDYVSTSIFSVSFYLPYIGQSQCPYHA